jgi:hypothetical protein
VTPQPDRYDYLDRNDGRDRVDEQIGEDTAWPLDVYDPDDREPMGGDPYWREDDR